MKDGKRKPYVKPDAKELSFLDAFLMRIAERFEKVSDAANHFGCGFNTMVTWMKGVSFPGELYHRELADLMGWTHERVLEEHAKFNAARKAAKEEKMEESHV